MKKGRNFDLSTEEDLAIAIMNLISLEEHFFFTGAKTDKPEYFDSASRSAFCQDEIARKNDRENGGRKLVYFKTFACDDHATL